MKRFVFSIFLLVVSSACFCQKQPYWYDSLIRTYNYLNNRPFAELELEDTSGNLVKTSSLLGKTVYVDFWFTTCPPCIKEIPFSKGLQEYFAEDTNIVFLSICIENVERKAAWKQMIKEKQMPGLHLFYARNRPQKINLLRQYKITFPTYLLVNTEMKVIGYDAPRPSETGWVHWLIEQAAKNISLAESFKLSVQNPKVIPSYPSASNGIIYKEKNIERVTKRTCFHTDADFIVDTTTLPRKSEITKGSLIVFDYTSDADNSLILHNKDTIQVSDVDFYERVTFKIKPGVDSFYYKGEQLIEADGLYEFHGGERSIPNTDYKVTKGWIKGKKVKQEWLIEAEISAVDKSDNNKVVQTIQFKEQFKKCD